MVNLWVPACGIANGSRGQGNEAAKQGRAGNGRGTAVASVESRVLSERRNGRGSEDRATEVSDDAQANDGTDQRERRRGGSLFSRSRWEKTRGDGNV